MRQFCHCLPKHYRDVFISALTCSITDFEKWSARVALEIKTSVALEKTSEAPEIKLSGTWKHEAQSIRMLIDDYTKIRDEVEALPLCGQKY